MTYRNEDKTSENPRQNSQGAADKSNDLDKYLDPLLEGFSKFLSKVIGDKIKLQFTSLEDRKKFSHAINEVKKRSREIEAIRRSNLPVEEKFVRITDITDSMIRDIAPEMTKGRQVIDWSISELEESIKKPESEMFLVAARYPEHSRTIDHLLHECVSKGHYSQLKQFLEEAEKEEVAFSKLQIFLARLTPAYEFLYQIFPTTRMNVDLDTSFRTQIRCQLIVKDSISRKEIDIGLQYYRDFAGEFEKQVRIIVGLLEILATGDKPNYRKIKGQALGVNLEELEKSEEYRGLAVPFSRTIRNALAHSNYSVDPVEEKVRFVDQHDELTLSFAEFLRKLADLSALVLAIWLLGNKVMLLEQRHIRDIYRQAKTKRERQVSRLD